MACACKVNQEIDRIHRYYSGNGSGRNMNTGMGINKKDAAITMLAYLILLPTIPLMILAVIIYTVFFNGQISFSKFLNFIHNTRNVTKQQVI